MTLKKIVKPKPDYVRCEFTEMIDVDKLVPNKDNPNSHTKKQIERLAKILQHQGIRKPIIVSRQSGFIVTGHGTLSAIKKNEWRKAPVSFQDFETPDQEYAHMVADNAMAEWSELDMPAINAKLPDIGPFDIELLGLPQMKVDPAEKKTVSFEAGEKKPVLCPECGHKFMP